MLKLIKSDVPYITAGLFAVVLLSLMPILTATNFRNIISMLGNDGSGQSIKTSTSIFAGIGIVSALALVLQVKH